MYFRSIAAAMLVASPAFAQAPAQSPNVTFTITITAQELDTIGNGLGSMPFKDAAPLINKLREQVIAQQKATAEAAKPVEKPVDSDKK